MAISRFKTSSVAQGLPKYQKLWDQISVTDAWAPIATAQITSGSQPYLDFTNIPQTYKHLQIRMYYKGDSVQNPFIRFGNGGTIDTGGNYSWHHWWTTGNATVSSNNNPSASFIHTGYQANTSYPAYSTMDILDYNSSDYKHIRINMGADIVGVGGEIGMFTGHWRSNSAIDTIRIVHGGNFTAGTHIALYGLKG